MSITPGAGRPPCGLTMRIQQQLSIILFVAVVGAIGLAVIVGTLLGGVEQAARRLEIAASQQRQMDRGGRRSGRGRAWCRMQVAWSVGRDALGELLEPVLDEDQALEEVISTRLRGRR